MKKLKGVINNPDAVAKGIYNFKFPTDSIEQAAKERAKICVGCEFYQDEPISFFKVEDKRIPELSNKLCSYCDGCTLSYKTRQNEIICKNWEIL